MPQKTVNCFIFVFSRRCKNSTPAVALAYKSTYTHHDSSVKNTDIIRGVLVSACANSCNRLSFLLFPPWLMFLGAKLIPLYLITKII